MSTPTSKGEFGRHGLRWLAGASVFTLHAAVVLLSVAAPLALLASTFVEDGRPSLEAWRNVLGGLDRWSTLIGSTLVTVGVALLVCGPAAVALALVVFRTRIIAPRICVAALLLAAALPVHIVGSVVLSSVGLAPLQGSAIAVGVAHGIAHLPIATLLVGVAVLGVSRETEEAALVDGSAPSMTLVRVTARASAPGIAAALLFVALLVATDYSISDLLLVRTFAEESYTQFALHGRPQEPFLVGLPQVVVLGALLWMSRRIFLRADGDAPAPASRPPSRLDLGRAAVPASIVALAAIAALVVVPAWFLLARARGVGEIARQTAMFRSELLTSLWTSWAAGAICGALAVGLAWRLVRGGRSGVALAAYVVLLLAVPAPVLGIGLVTLFSRPGLPGVIYDSPWMLVVAYVVRFLPIAVILVTPAVRSVPRECELSARLDGCGDLAVWSRVVVPLCGRAAVTAALVVAILSMGELPCSLMVTPPGYQTVGSRFFSLIHYGLYADAASLCILTVCAVIVPWGGMLFLLRRRSILDRFDMRPTRPALLAVAITAAALSGCDRSTREVVVYTALDRAFSEPIFEAFTAKTGIAVRAHYDTESTKTVGLTNRIRAERERPRCDVFWNNEILNTLRLRSEGLLEKFEPREAKRFPEQFRDPEGYWYGFAARARVLIVNTDLVPRDRFPTSIHDLADPAWAGKTGIAKPLFGTTASHVACLFEALGDREATELLERFRRNDIQVHGGNKGCAVAVAAGSAAFALTDTDDAIIEKEAGKPVEIVYPDSGAGQLGTLLLPNTLAIVRGAPHRPEALELVDFLLGPEVEEMLARGPSAQIPLHPDARPSDRVKRAADLRPMQVDFEAAAAAFERARDVVERRFLH